MERSYWDGLNAIKISQIRAPTHCSKFLSRHPCALVLYSYTVTCTTLPPYYHISPSLTLVARSSCHVSRLPHQHYSSLSINFDHNFDFFNPGILCIFSSANFIFTVYFYMFCLVMAQNSEILHPIHVVLFDRNYLGWSQFFRNFHKDRELWCKGDWTNLMQKLDEQVENFNGALSNGIGIITISLLGCATPIFRLSLTYLVALIMLYLLRPC